MLTLRIHNFKIFKIASQEHVTLKAAKFSDKDNNQIKRKPFFF